MANMGIHEKLIIFISLVLAVGGNAFAGVQISPSKSHDLLELLFAFAIPESSPDNIQDWAVGAKKKDRIEWTTTGVEWKDNYGQRLGSAIVTINRKPLYVLKKNLEPAAWEITLRGNHAGVFEANVSSPTSRELSQPDLESMLHKMGASHSTIMCDEIGGFSNGSRVYEVKVPRKKTAWLYYDWSCGSGGCQINLALLLDKPSPGKRETGLPFLPNCPAKN
jgi:hypothetical protein